MKINNAERFIDAAKWLFKMYLKYTDSSMIHHKPKQPEIIWEELRAILYAIFTNDFIVLEKIFGSNCGITSSRKLLMMKILGMNSKYRVEMYHESQFSTTSCVRYEKNK